MSPDFNFGVNASREGLIEKMRSLTEKWHWHDMALSEHGFHAPKLFTISSCLTNTKVGIWGPTPSNRSKNQKSLLDYPRWFWIGFGSTGGSEDEKSQIKQGRK